MLEFARDLVMVLGRATTRNRREEFAMALAKDFAKFSRWVAWRILRFIYACSCEGSRDVLDVAL